MTQFMMESSVQPKPQVTNGMYRSSNAHGDHLELEKVRQELIYINTIGKRFVAAIDRFHVHRALLFALQELYSFSACCILLKENPVELFIIPCQPLSAAFFEDMLQRIVSAAHVIDFPSISVEQLISSAYFDAPDEVAQYRTPEAMECTEIGSVLNVPLIVENRIIGMLSLFDELVSTFDTEMLHFTTMIADYAAVALDNVRLRERENALWRQADFERQRLELVIRSMAEGLLITDAKGIVTSLNQSARQLFEQAHITLQDEFPFRINDLALTEEKTWLCRLAQIIDTALTDHVITNQELIVGEPGETVPLTLNVSASPLHNASGVTPQPIGVVAVINDVTSNKQIEKLKDEFVSIVSHELRTPLTTIKGYTQHLIRRIERRIRRRQVEIAPYASSPSDSPESQDLRSLYIVHSQSDHLERLVNELLDLSQVQNGQLALQYSTFHLADVLSETIHSVQMSSEQHTIYLDIQITDTLLKADRHRIAQVIGNILDNAVKYSPHGGQITVSLQRQAHEYLISITDQGVGIQPDQIDHIFERFYRVRNMNSRQYAGVGLGLYVAKAIIERHGGKIGVHAQQGTGTTFYFTLPCIPHTPAETEHEEIKHM